MSSQGQKTPAPAGTAAEQPRTSKSPDERSTAEVFLNRMAVARRLGVSKASVVRWHMSGELPSTIRNTPGGQKIYMTRLSDVEAMLVERAPTPRTMGEVAAAAFQLFAAGKDLKEIVITLRQPPEVIRRFYAEWFISLEEGEAQRELESASGQGQREADRRRSSEAELTKLEQRLRKDHK